MNYHTDNSEYDEITDLGIDKPHVVILGAGASKASFPNGDKNGHIVPLMNDLINICELEPILEEHGVCTDICNFEELYNRSQLPKMHSDV